MSCCCRGCGGGDPNVFSSGGMVVCEECITLYEDENDLHTDIITAEGLEVIVAYHSTRFRKYISNYRREIRPKKWGV